MFGITDSKLDINCGGWVFRIENENVEDYRDNVDNSSNVLYKFTFLSDEWWINFEGFKIIKFNDIAKLCRIEYRLIFR